MVKHTVKVGRLFSWNSTFNVDENNIQRIFIHEGNRVYYIVPSAKTIDALNEVQDKFRAIIDTHIIIEGTVTAIWETQMVEEPPRMVAKIVEVTEK